MNGGNAMVKIKDVAAKAGVSAITLADVKKDTDMWIAKEEM